MRGRKEAPCLHPVKQWSLRNPNLSTSLLERFSYDLENGFGKCSLFVLSANGWKDQNMASSFSRRRHCLIGQWCYSMTSKRSISWLLESSQAWSFFTRAFAKPTKSHARLYPFDKPIKSFYFRSFVVSALFARFHFKVIRKSVYALYRQTSFPSAIIRLLMIITESQGSK